jgi:GxxExxY protein
MSLEFDDLSNRVIGCAIRVHRELGPGLLESTYEQCVAYELIQSGIPFKIQQPIPVAYKQIKLDCGYRVDLLVEDRLIVELERRAVVKDPRSASLDLPEACQYPNWASHQFQRADAQKGHQEIRSLTKLASSCSSRASW